MLIKPGFLVLCFLAEIALGIYTYLHFEDLLVRFMLFVLTAIFVAMIVIKLAGPVKHKKGENFSQKFSEEGKNKQILAEE